jgi:hypothetical protein
MSVLSAAHRGLASYPVLAFMLISHGVGFVTAAIPPIADSEILPFDQPLHGLVGGSLGPLFPIRCVTRPGSAARFHPGSANGRALDDDAFGAAISLLVGHPLAATGRSRVRSSPVTA